MEKTNFHLVPLADIHVSEDNVRTSELDIGIDDLAESIDEFGLFQPVVLMGEYGKNADKPYSLIIGQRRFLAHKKLKRKEIKAVFIPKTDSYEAKAISLSENILRKQLTYDDTSKAITFLYGKYKNVKQVANKLGVSVGTIYEYLNINETATPKLKQLIDQKKISKEDAKRAIKIASGNKTKLNEIVEELHELTKFQKDQALNISKKDPSLTAKETIKKAREAPVTYTLALFLPKELNEALDKAKVSLNEERESIAVQAVREWLIKNGFLKQ